jgi:hypothetical protein
MGQLTRIRPARGSTGVNNLSRIASDEQNNDVSRGGWATALKEIYMLAKKGHQPSDEFTETSA